MNESNFVVKTIFHACGSSEVLTENYFATRKEAEEFCANSCKNLYIQDTQRSAKTAGRTIWFYI